ncbi:uncharacterized protein GGS25DRAFT_506352 [Hypoxylon fragiforme]|uniref:uncharacterized protein n=1 Tax=Hypoxylon fragiforme TaxID=63214 RepID=UPI0020C5C78A|nr:uncharacterized protein GGS25DRAFT_506352 [Hypoxylon fragiforme]KAI2603975.1 hypothetical protein GGS25DRAFT_506352 [Hypoxylon fragiforme]
MFVLFLLANLCLAVAQDSRRVDPNNHFIYPPLPGPPIGEDPHAYDANINFIVGKAPEQSFKWVSNITSLKVQIVQETPPNVENQYVIRDCDPGSDNTVHWDGQIGDIDLAHGLQAYLGAWDCAAGNDAAPVFFSHYINLVATPPPSSANTSLSPSPEVPPAAEDNSPAGINAGTVIGVAFGIGALATLVLTVVFYLGVKRGRTTERREQEANRATWMDDMSGYEMGPPPASNVETAPVPLPPPQPPLPTYSESSDRKNAR